MTVLFLVGIPVPELAVRGSQGSERHDLVRMALACVTVVSESTHTSIRLARVLIVARLTSILAYDVGDLHWSIKFIMDDSVLETWSLQSS